MKNIYEWNNEYGLYHKNKTNKIIHWICVPIIMFTLFGLLSLVNFSIYNINILQILIVLSLFFYMRLSISLSIGMALISAVFYYIILLLETIDFFNTKELLLLYLLTFIVAWFGQFIGHKIEGKKPAFFKDLQFLLIGPVWLLSFIYNKLNIKLK